MDNRRYVNGYSIKEALRLNDQADTLGDIIGIVTSGISGRGPFEWIGGQVTYWKPFLIWKTISLFY